MFYATDVLLFYVTDNLFYVTDVLMFYVKYVLLFYVTDVLLKCHGSLPGHTNIIMSDVLCYRCSKV